MSCQLLCDL